MKSAAYDLARSRQTAEPLMVNVLLARKVNGLMGGAVITPWEIDQMPDEQIDAVLNLERVGEYRQGLAQVEDVFAKWRSDNARK